MSNQCLGCHIGVLEKMQRGEFEDAENPGDFRTMPEPPEIDQMKKDELYELQPPGSG